MQQFRYLPRLLVGWFGLRSGVLLLWQSHVVDGAGASSKLREDERGGGGAWHGLRARHERQLLPELCGKVEPPGLVERLSLALSAKEEHHGEELDRAVAVQEAGAGLGLDRAPTARN